MANDSIVVQEFGSFDYDQIPDAGDAGSLPVYIDIRFYFTAAILAAWETGGFGATLISFFGVSGTPNITADITASVFDNWALFLHDSPPAQTAGYTEGWHRFQILLTPSGGTNRFDVDGTEVDWTSGRTGACTLIRMGNDGGPGGDGPVYVGAIRIGTGWDTADILDFDPATASDLSQFDNVTDSALGTSPAPPPPPAVTRYRTPFWRFVVLDLKTFETLSFLDRLASQRTATYTLNQAAVATGVVPSDNPEVNIPWPSIDDDPFLAEGTRVLLGFRREGVAPDPPWVIRFAGIIMQMEDTAASDDSFSSYTAYDPWQYLLSRPVCNADGSLPGPDGISFTATHADVIAQELLANTIFNQGPVGVDAGAINGGTGFYDGTIETCIAIDINFAQGTTVGQAWQQLCDLDVCDIVLAPIYDPKNRPGYLCQFNIYTEVGSILDDQIFAWDMPSRSLVGISRLVEGGTQRANKVKYFSGQGGSATGGQTIPVQTDAGSVARFGEYWRQQFFPGQNVAAAVQQLAQAQLQLSAAGKVTVAISPAPQRSPIPFEDFFLGDRVPVYASDRFRAPIPDPATSGSMVQYQRIYGIPLLIADDASEQINQMLTAIPN